MEQLSVPVIDIAPFLRDASSPEATAVISAIRDACLTCGFFLVTGHSVPEADISRCWSSVRDFFDESVELKIETPMRVSYPYGYSGMGSEKAGNDIKSGAYDTSDLKESFAICLSSATKPAPALPTPLWPRSPPGFKDAVTTYYRDMEALSSSLLSILALTLELPRDYFASLSDQHWGALRCLNYPSQSVAPNPGQLRIAAHTDYGALTLLKADDAPGGLQVQRKDGSWSDVSIPSDAYCVNLGDLMSRLSNDMYKSTMHRVVNPPLHTAVSTRRQSIAYFCNLNREATVAVVPSCITTERPARYPPINAFEHLMQRHAIATGASAYKPEEAAATTTAS